MGGIKFTIKKVLGGYYFLVMSFIFGCCVSCKQTVNNIDKTDSKNIKILNENTILSISLDEIIDSVSYIALDTKECLLADIEVVKRDNEYLFIKDKNRLFVFDNNGNFISQISNIGNAPHEYLYIKDFYLDKKNKYIFIISYPDKKLLQYSYNGDFISSSNNLPEEISSISSAILLTKDSLMIYNALSNDINTRISEYALYLNNPYKFEIKPLIKGIDNKSDKIHYPFIYKPMTFLDNKLFMISALSNTVYSFEKGILTDTFSICLPNLAPPVSLLKDNEGLDFSSLKKVVKEEWVGVWSGSDDYGDYEITITADGMSYTQYGSLYSEWYVIGENKFVVGDYNISYDSAKDVMILDAYGSIVELSKSSSEPGGEDPTPSESLNDALYGTWNAVDPWDSSMAGILVISADSISLEYYGDPYSEYIVSSSTEFSFADLSTFVFVYNETNDTIEMKDAIFGDLVLEFTKAER